MKRSLISFISTFIENIFIKMSSTKEKIKNFVAKVWDVLRRPIMGLVIIFIYTVIMNILIFLGYYIPPTPIIFYLSISLTLVSAFVIFSRNSIGLFQRRLKRVTLGLYAIFVSLGFFKGYYKTPYPGLLEVSYFIFGIISLIMGILILISAVIQDFREKNFRT